MKIRSCFLTVCLVLVAGVIPSSAFAADSGWTTITQIISYDNANVNFRANATVEGCSQTNGYRINSVNEEGSNLYKLLLAAFLAGREVRMITSGTSGCTPGGWNTVTEIRLR